MKRNNFEIDVGKDFSRFPAGRTPDDGRYSGEAFRERFLKENFAKGQKVIILLDSALSYGSSFLEESFGGIVRNYGYKADTLRELLDLRSKDPFLIDEIWSYITDASLNDRI